LRQKTGQARHKFLSQTDTEVSRTWWGHHLDQKARNGSTAPTPEMVSAAIEQATREATGTYAIAVMHSKLPDQLFGARRDRRSWSALGRTEYFLASDVSPIAASCQTSDLFAPTATSVTRHAGGFQNHGQRQAGQTIHGVTPVKLRRKKPRAWRLPPHYMLKRNLRATAIVWRTYLKQKSIRRTGAVQFQESRPPPMPRERAGEVGGGRARFIRYSP